MIELSVLALILLELDGVDEVALDLGEAHGLVPRIPPSRIIFRAIIFPLNELELVTRQHQQQVAALLWLAD